MLNKGFTGEQLECRIEQRLAQERIGPWMRSIDGADAVVNLAGRSVNCRYTREHLREMMDSRVDSTRAVGVAIQQAMRPPRV